MVGNMPTHTDHNSCPVLCITKVCLFVVTTLFVLYLPLGDPKLVCNAKNVPQNQKGLVCARDIYDFMVKLSETTCDTIDILACKAIDVLYDAKLKFYTILSTYDRDDYCRVGCSCSEKDENDCVKEKKSACKCRYKCCRRR